MPRNEQYFNPACAMDISLTRGQFGLFPVRSPLLRESLLFSFPPGTEMFHFPGLSSCSYVFRAGSPMLNRRGLPIRKSPAQRLFAPPRRLSQLTTSFINGSSQGIHHILYSSLTTSFNPPPMVIGGFVIRLIAFALSYQRTFSLKLRIKTPTAFTLRIKFST